MSAKLKVRSSLGNFWGGKAVIVFIVFAFNIKVSIILKIIK